ncbi:uncharacterized protein Z518_00943 [Rhinocladiella mackenziei CBS 650.93]|uniref:Gamma-glutamylcyclotransferase n=1 Tax=Rhinocladiella mackenziei CBS 650.93 TaxID=1442369 RepID=A0A0D2G532_9EURO|nr:uncharacterized protein Z518_00943 [Rhinocladiella mackenziei CBS 650.93]KIX09862.1 hypothetical protein Z518_00943 [Rhinocladiella mackenziei CBS 650.93]
MALGESEGVLWLYEKRALPGKRVPNNANRLGRARRCSSLAITYVDVQKKSMGKFEGEYVVWVNKAIEDSPKCGMPRSYVEKYLGPFLPTGDRKLEDDKVGLVPRGLASWSRG